MLPNFLICGASKSGTTTLQEVLCTHPDIFMPKKKRANGREIHFFNNDKNFAKGIEWYEKQFEGWNGEKAIGEKTPSYLCTPCVPERIHRFLPDVKLIFILRHPVDTYNQSISFLNALYILYLLLCQCILYNT